MTVRIFNRLFNTQPIATHCPGPVHKRWQTFAAAVLNQPNRACVCDDVTIITWNTGNRFDRQEKPCGLLEKSLRILGVPVVVLGQGRKHWTNLDKFQCTADALAKIKTPYVIGADSADIVFLDNPQIAVDRFRQHFTCKLLFNATGSRCWPELPELVRFQASLPMAAVAQGRHWINSGLFIGETDFVYKYMKQMTREPAIPGFIGSDQGVVMRTWPQWYPQVQADYLSQIFQWFNEELDVMHLRRPIADRQSQLIQWIRRLDRRIVGAEVGVARGNTSEALLAEFPELSLWMVDPWSPFEGESQFDKSSQAEFDSAMEAAMLWTEFARHRRYVVRQASPGAAERFSDSSLDFVFIDGNHLYENVVADIAAWWPKVKRGGLLIGHDYAVYGDADGKWGVKRAVDEFVSAIDRELTRGLDGTWMVVR